MSTDRTENPFDSRESFANAGDSPNPGSAQAGLPNINVTVNTGPQGPQAPQVPVEQRKTSVTFGLWCLGVIGVCGVHRFYLGKYVTGFIWLVTLGLLGVGQIIDLFRVQGMTRQVNLESMLLPPTPTKAQETRGPEESPQADRQLPASRQHRILKAAQASGGVVTLAQVVTQTGMSFEQAETTLDEMVAKGYVDIGNHPNSGVVVYRFPGLADSA